MVREAECSIVARHHTTTTNTSSNELTQVWAIDLLLLLYTTVQQLNLSTYLTLN